MKDASTPWSRFVDRLCLRFHERVERARRAAQRANVCARIDPTATVHPEAEIANPGRKADNIVIGANSHVRGQLFTFWKSGRIRLGRWTYIGHDSRIWSQNSVEIGDHVLISHLVDIHDTNSHPIDVADRRADVERILGGRDYASDGLVQTAPVVIEDGAWIGFKASILKGVRVGRGAIVAAAAVVTKDVPPFTLVAGNPARVIRELPHRDI